MLANYFLISGRREVWLCSSLEPIQRVARFNPYRVAALFKLPSRPGSPYAYMETCEVDCDIEGDVVTKVRKLIIVRGTVRHQIV